MQAQAREQGRRASQASTRNDVGRRVQVLWVRPGFPKYQRPTKTDLRAYRGRVVEHRPDRGAKTHRVLYTDKQLAWTALDAIKFLD